MSFSFSDILPLISFCSLPLLSLPPSRYLSSFSLDLSMLYLSQEKSRERKLKDIGWEREQREIGRRLENEIEKIVMRGERVYMCLEMKNQRLEMTPAKTPRQRTTREFLFYCRSERGLSSSFFSAPNEETTARLQR